LLLLCRRCPKRSAEAPPPRRQLYDSFSEGFATPNLPAAKALLDALEQDGAYSV
jgi:hypothetical protein